MARRRELSAVVGQLSMMEDCRRKNSDLAVHCIICGDFNSTDDELVDGCFAGVSTKGGGHFQDAWTTCTSSRGENAGGFTWDPLTNPRAAISTSNKTCRRRIDRVYVKKSPYYDGIKCDSKMITGQEHSSEQVSLPPSDHYGLAVKLSQAGTKYVHGKVSNTKAKYCPYDSWSAT